MVEITARLPAEPGAWQSEAEVENCCYKYKRMILCCTDEEI